MSVAWHRARWERFAARGLLLPVLTGAGALAALLYVSQVDPHEAGHYPTCPSLALAGVYCPGCGTLRAAHALTRGDLATVLDRNPLFLPAAAFIAWEWWRWTRGRVTGRPRPRWVAPAWALHLLFWGLLAYMAVRNVPGWTWLSPQ